MSQGKTEIFFHVGLGKTATTYLQYEFFPKLRGIRYIQRTKYKDFDKIYQKENVVNRFFISREFDQQLHREVKQFGAKYPDAKLIIIFRRHDGWIASQYRRFVKNGFGGTFTEFYDPDKNTGQWKHDDLDYMSKIKSIEAYFKHKPLVLFYEDLKANPHIFFDAFDEYLGVSYSKYDISLKPTHKSYNTKQLKAMRWVGSKVLSQKPKWSKIRFVRWLQRRSRLLICYLILYPAMLFPEDWFSNEPLIDPEELEKVRIRFADDWQAVHDYARKNNWSDHLGTINPSLMRLGKILNKAS